MSYASLFGKHYGGTWRYNRQEGAWSDNRGRTIRTSVVMGGMSGDDPVGRATWLYAPNKPPELVQIELLRLGVSFNDKEAKP